MAVVKRRRLNRRLRSLLAIVFVAFGIYLSYQVYLRYETSKELKAQLAEAQLELENLNNENSDLESQVSKLNDDSYIQSYARGNYMYSKNDEKVFYLPKIEK